MPDPIDAAERPVLDALRPDLQPLYLRLTHEERAAYANLPDERSREAYLRIDDTVVREKFPRLSGYQREIFSGISDPYDAGRYVDESISQNELITTHKSLVAAGRPGHYGILGAEAFFGDYMNEARTLSPHLYELLLLQDSIAQREGASIFERAHVAFTGLQSLMPGLFDPANPNYNSLESAQMREEVIASLPSPNNGEQDAKLALESLTRRFRRLTNMAGLGVTLYENLEPSFKSQFNAHLDNLKKSGKIPQAVAQKASEVVSSKSVTIYDPTKPDEIDEDMFAALAQSRWAEDASDFVATALRDAPHSVSMPAPVAKKVSKVLADFVGATGEKVALVPVRTVAMDPRPADYTGLEEELQAQPVQVAQTPSSSEKEESAEAARSEQPAPDLARRVPLRVPPPAAPEHPPEVQVTAPTRVSWSRDSLVSALSLSHPAWTDPQRRFIADKLLEYHRYSPRTSASEAVALLKDAGMYDVALTAVNNLIKKHEPKKPQAVQR